MAKDMMLVSVGQKEKKKRNNPKIHEYGKGTYRKVTENKDERGIRGFGIAKFMKMYYAYVWNCSRTN